MIKWGRKPQYNPVTGTWIEVGLESETICRASPNSGGSKLFHDGLEIEYSFNIAFPRNITILPQGGDEIKIYDTRGVKIYEGILLRIHYGSASIRAWA